MNERIVRKDAGEISTGKNIMYVEWQIKKFFSLSQKVDNCIRSPSFQVKDAKWYLCVYPNGETEFQTAGYVNLLLVKEDCGTLIHRASYYIGINKHNGTVYKSWRGEEDFKMQKGWGVFPLIDRTIFDTLKSELFPNGVVTFFCYLHVKSTRSVLKMSEGVGRLINDFKNLLRSHEDSDVTFKVKDKEFKAHKVILRARSSAFSSILSHGNVDKNSGEVDVANCEPESFQHYLTYLYSGCLENPSNDVVLGLYFVASKYGDEEVKAKCVELLASNLSVETFYDAFSLCKRYNESDLLEAATDFFARNAKEIIVTPQWQSLIKENPAAVNELYLQALESCGK